MLRAAGVTAVVAVAASVLLVVLGATTGRGPAAFCAERPSAFPAAGVQGWRGEQLENAATIVRTAEQLGFERNGQILGVMTAMGESSLRNLDHGDWETRGITNPDGSRTTSIGLFQQQSWWGSAEERMDPATAATLFYARLARIPDWPAMEPSSAINRVQVNSDRDYYARFEDEAAAVVDALSGSCPAGAG